MHKLILYIVMSGMAFGTWAQTPFCIMQYNVENLFDTKNDVQTNDDEFLETSSRRWTLSRYWHKLDGLAKVIAAVGEERLPALIALCEVENDSVLYDLTKRSSLRAVGYRYVVTQSADPRGIDVALLYQPGMFRLLEHHTIKMPSVENGYTPTRDILHVRGQVISGDTLDVLVCHFPSRSRGTRKADEHRVLAATTLRCSIDSLFMVHPHAKVVVAGDFNAAPGDMVFTKILCAHEYFYMQNNRVDSALINGADATMYLTTPRRSKVKNKTLGSYRYRGEWMFLDHILVSENLLDSASIFRCIDKQVQVADFPFLLVDDQTYGGKRPHRTYQGPSYRGGYSDHLPIYLNFVVNKKAQQNTTR